MHDESTTLIPLPHDKFASVDSVDAERVLTGHRWRVDADGYVIRGGGRNKVKGEKLHRYILDAPFGVEVDHINRDKLDNRRSNLRYVTHTENCVNAGLRRTNTSGFKGVSWHKRTQRWRADIRVNYRRIWIGLFDTAEEAAHAYDDAAAAEWGDAAFLNFPD